MTIAVKREESIRTVIESLAPGERCLGRLPIGSMASGSEFSIPYVVIKGARPGKTLWVNGQVHGSEVTGVVATIEFMNRLDPAELAGTVVATTTANPLALDARLKHAPQDENDMDQTFPGKPNGFTSERMASRLFDEIQGVADLVVAMHAQHVHVTTRTYTVFKTDPSGRVAESSLYPYMADYEPHVVCRMNTVPGQGELLGNIAGALDYQLQATGTPCFMVELGVGQRAAEEEVERGIRGLMNNARRLGIVAGAAPEWKEITLVTARGHVTLSHGGLFKPLRAAGDVVPAGEPLGVTMNIWGEQVETATLPMDVRIIAIRCDPVVHSGDRFGYMARTWETVSLEGGG